MALIPLASIEDLSGVPREVAESGTAQYGKTLNTWAALMNKPDLFASYLPFLREVVGPGELDREIKELSALLVASLNRCEYSLSHRATSAKANGISEDRMRQVVQMDWAQLDGRLAAALELTRQLTMLPPSVDIHQMPHGIEPDLREHIQSIFTPIELLELTLSISLWNALTRFHRVMGFEQDMPDAPVGVALR